MVKTVTMTCMTTKQKFEVDDPEVVQLRNGRFAYRVECPWKGKNDRVLTAYKFCSARDFEQYMARASGDELEVPETSKSGTESEHCAESERGDEEVEEAEL